MKLVHREAVRRRGNTTRRSHREMCVRHWAWTSLSLEEKRCEGGAEYNESHSLHCEMQDYFIRNLLLELSKGFNKMILILLHYHYGAVIIHRCRLFPPPNMPMLLFCIVLLWAVHCIVQAALQPIELELSIMPSCTDFLHHWSHSIRLSKMRTFWLS